MKRAFTACAGRIALGVWFPLLCVAQPKPPDLLAILVTKVKPDMVQQYEEIQKNEIMPALKKGGTPWRGVSQTAAFGELNVFVSATPIDKFAQYDAPTALTRALGEAGAAKLLAKLNRCVVEMRRYAMRFRPDLSFETPEAAKAPISVVSFVKVSPGKTLEFERFVKNEVTPAIKKAELPGYFVHQPVFGGDANDWVTVALYRKYAELDGGTPFVRALGEDGAARLTAKASTLIDSISRIISRSRPDLSFFPAPPK